MRKPAAAKAAPPKATAAKANASSKLSHRELRCAVIIAILLATPLATAQAIAKEQGAGGNEYIKRLIQHLQTHGSLDDGPRNTQPRIYTDEVFEAALDVLGCFKVITEAQLVHELQRLGILPPGKRDPKYFFLLLKGWCAERGFVAKAGVTRGEPFLNTQDFGARLKYVKQLRELMKDKGYSWSDLVFMDETSVNASNHPKCRCRHLHAGAKHRLPSDLMINYSACRDTHAADRFATPCDPCSGYCCPSPSHHHSHGHLA
jgi:hypothetical protein